MLACNCAGALEPYRLRLVLSIEKALCRFFFSPLRVVQLRSQVDLSQGTAVSVDADEVLQWMRSGLRRDSVVVVALTMAPLVSSGVATIGATDWDGRVGVFSLAACKPIVTTPTAVTAGPLGTSNDPGPCWHSTCRETDATVGAIYLERAAKLLLHSTVHMFGVLHCCYYRCLMNGARTCEEADSLPPYLCGLCLKKLQLVLGFDVLDRYERLADAWMKAGAHDVASWYLLRVALLHGSMAERQPRAWCKLEKPLDDPAQDAAIAKDVQIGDAPHSQRDSHSSVTSSSSASVAGPGPPVSQLTTRRSALKLRAATTRQRDAYHETCNALGLRQRATTKPAKPIRGSLAEWRLRRLDTCSGAPPNDDSSNKVENSSQ